MLKKIKSIFKPKFIVDGALVPKFYGVAYYHQGHYWFVCYYMPINLIIGYMRKIYLWIKIKFWRKIMLTKEQEAIKLILEEYKRAVEIHGNYQSAHEGYAIILEELNELWDEIKKKNYKHNPSFIQQEAIHLANTALRFIVDICLKNENKVL